MTAFAKKTLSPEDQRAQQAAKAAAPMRPTRDRQSEMVADYRAKQKAASDEAERRRLLSLTVNNMQAGAKAAMGDVDSLKAPLNLKNPKDWQTEFQSAAQETNAENGLKRMAALQPYVPVHLQSVYITTVGNFLMANAGGRRHAVKAYLSAFALELRSASSTPERGAEILGLLKRAYGILGETHKESLCSDIDAFTPQTLAALAAPAPAEQEDSGEYDAFVSAELDESARGGLDRALESIVYDDAFDALDAALNAYATAPKALRRKIVNYAHSKTRLTVLMTFVCAGDVARLKRFVETFNDVLDKTAKDLKGQTAADLAVQFDHLDAVALVSA